MKRGGGARLRARDLRDRSPGREKELQYSKPTVLVSQKTTLNKVFLNHTSDFVPTGPSGGRDTLACGGMG